MKEQGLSGCSHQLVPELAFEPRPFVSVSGAHTLAAVLGKGVGTG